MTSEEYNSEHSLYSMIVDAIVGSPRRMDEVLEKNRKLSCDIFNQVINLLVRQFNAIDWELIPEEEELDEIQLIANELSKNDEKIYKILVHTLNWSIDAHRINRAHKHCSCK